LRFFPFRLCLPLHPFDAICASSSRLISITEQPTDLQLQLSPRPAFSPSPHPTSSLLAPTKSRPHFRPPPPRNSRQVAGQTPKYNWTFPSLALIAREEGLGALYSGFLPKVLRLAPGGGVLLLVVEFTLDMFRKQLGAPYL
jgi:hypothetical protein